MKIKLPLILRCKHERVVSELEKDIYFLENKNKELDLDIKEEKSDKESVRCIYLGSLKMSNARNKELNDKNIELKKIITKLDTANKILDEESSSHVKKIKALEWCIQERDKVIKRAKENNRNIVSKIN